jgi:hypothetical protein
MSGVWDSRERQPRRGLPGFVSTCQADPCQRGAAARTGFPSKQKILEARDRVLANDPQLHLVGVHLISASIRRS